jgi:hypothetical protein
VKVIENILIAEFGSLQSARNWAKQNKSHTYWHKAIEALDAVTISLTKEEANIISEMLHEISGKKDCRAGCLVAAEVAMRIDESLGIRRFAKTKKKRAEK